MAFTYIARFYSNRHSFDGGCRNAQLPHIRFAMRQRDICMLAAVLAAGEEKGRGDFSGRANGMLSGSEPQKDVVCRHLLSFVRIHLGNVGNARWHHQISVAGGQQLLSIEPEQLPSMLCLISSGPQ
jgi:hypothetical protein